MEKEHKTKTLHSVRVEKIEIWSFFITCTTIREQKMKTESPKVKRQRKSLTVFHITSLTYLTLTKFVISLHLMVSIV